MFFALALLKTTEAQAQRLDDIVDIISYAWKNGDAKAPVALAAREGVVIEVSGSRSGPVGARQAVAMLRRVFDERQTIGLRQGMTQIVGGTPRRAFAEITWMARAPDTTEPERYTIYLELVLEGDRWHITQIRLLQ